MTLRIRPCCQTWPDVPLNCSERAGRISVTRHRCSRDARDAYAKVKQEAAQVWSDDRIAYTEAKTGVVLDLLDAAEIWAMANSWTVIHPPG